MAQALVKLTPAQVKQKSKVTLFVSTLIKFTVESKLPKTEAYVTGARIAFSQYIEKNPAINEDQTKQLAIQCLRAIAWGLSLFPSDGQAWIIPFKGTPVLITGYKGHIRILNSNGYSNIDVVFVHNDEEISFTSQSGIVHKMRDASRFVELRDAKCSYVTFTLEGVNHVSNPYSHLVWEQAKRRAKTVNNPRSPWNENYRAMAIKTILIRFASTRAIAKSEQERIYKVESMLEEKGLADTPEGDVIDVDTPLRVNIGDEDAS